MPADTHVPTPPGEATPPTPMSPQDMTRLAQGILTEVATAVVGMEGPLRIALAAILAGGHVLFEDVPGLGKTLAARSLASAVGLDFQRLQCTPDLLPSDITGSYVFNPATTTFEFRPGPVFTGLLLADEINRTSPKTQSALLEAMAERQVSVEGTTFALRTPFHVMATSNPVEYEGTYPLPEAQLDRFMVRVAVGYPSRQGEIDVLRRRLGRSTDLPSVAQVIDAAQLADMQAGVAQLTVDEDLLGYAVDLTAATRTHPDVDLGASPRGSQALVLMARALAVLHGRAYVVPDDIKEAAVPVLAHRMTLNAQMWAAGQDPAVVVEQVLARIPGPGAAPGR